MSSGEGSWMDKVTGTENKVVLKGEEARREADSASRPGPTGGSGWVLTRCRRRSSRAWSIRGSSSDRWPWRLARDDHALARTAATSPSLITTFLMPSSLSRPRFPALRQRLRIRSSASWETAMANSPRPRRKNSRSRRSMLTTFSRGRMLCKVFSERDWRMPLMVLERLTLLMGNERALMSRRLAAMLCIPVTAEVVLFLARMRLMDLPMKRIDEAVAGVTNDGMSSGTVV